MVFNKVNYPPLRRLRQQTPNTIFRVSSSLPQLQTSHPRANRTRLPKLDENVVKVQPLPDGCFSDGFHDVGTDIKGGQAVRRKDRDLLKIPMFGCDGPECPDEPVDVR